MSLRARQAESHGWRVEAALHFRCRRGEAEALATLLYRLMDRLYTAASFVAPDETSAQTACILAWEDTLALLTRPHVGGHLQRRAFGLLAARLLDFADRRTVRRALHNALREDEDSLLLFPDEQLQPLVELTHRYAPDIAAAQAERQSLRRRVRQAMAAAGLLIVAYSAWLGLHSGETQRELRLSLLQQRIMRGNLIESCRDCWLELADPQGADRPQAHLLQQSSLALEEILNARSGSGLRYVLQRVRQEALAEELAELAEQHEGLTRTELLQVQLLLEEVQAL